MDTIIKPTLDETATEVVINPRPSTDFYKDLSISEPPTPPNLDKPNKTDCAPVVAAVEAKAAKNFEIHIHELVNEFTAFSESRDALRMKLKRSICAFFWGLLISSWILTTDIGKGVASLVLLLASFIGIIVASAFVVTGLGAWTMAWCRSE
jgi:hypothetical protein